MDEGGDHFTEALNLNVAAAAAWKFINEALGQRHIQVEKNEKIKSIKSKEYFEGLLVYLHYIKRHSSLNIRFAIRKIKHHASS